MKKLLFVTLLLISYNSFSQIVKFKANWYGYGKESIEEELPPLESDATINLDFDKKKLTIADAVSQTYKLSGFETENAEGIGKVIATGTDEYGDSSYTILIAYMKDNKVNKYTIQIFYQDVYWFYWADKAN